MSALAMAVIAFLFMLGGGFAGALLRKTLPQHHLGEDTKDLIRLGTGLIGTMAALVLGLLIGSANGAFSTQSSRVQRMTSDVILIDNLLAQYGQQAHETRDRLRQAVRSVVEGIWEPTTSHTTASAPFHASASGTDAFTRIQTLSPQTPLQESLKARAVEASADLAQSRLLLHTDNGSAIPFPFLVVLIFWLSIIFASFGMFSHFNPVAVGALVVFAISAAGAIFLILELGQPFSGIMQIPSGPLLNALGPV
jgi:hypothetical protein